MKLFRWNCIKKELLVIERGVSFERIVIAIDSGGLLDILKHPNRDQYPKQFLMVVACDDYVFLVPYIEEDEYLFMKTIIPSRKATKEYLKHGEKND